MGGADRDPAFVSNHRHLDRVRPIFLLERSGAALFRPLAMAVCSPCSLVPLIAHHRAHDGPILLPPCARLAADEAAQGVIERVSAGSSRVPALRAASSVCSWLSNAAPAARLVAASSAVPGPGPFIGRTISDHRRRASSSLAGPAGSSSRTELIAVAVEATFRRVIPGGARVILDTSAHRNAINLATGAPPESASRSGAGAGRQN